MPVFVFHSHKFSSALTFKGRKRGPPPPSLKSKIQVVGGHFVGEAEKALPIAPSAVPGSDVQVRPKNTPADYLLPGVGVDAKRLEAETNLYPVMIGIDNRVLFVPADNETVKPASDMVYSFHFGSRRSSVISVSSSPSCRSSRRSSRAVSLLCPPSTPATTLPPTPKESTADLEGENKFVDVILDDNAAPVDYSLSYPPAPPPLRVRERFVLKAKHLGGLIKYAVTVMQRRREARRCALIADESFEAGFLWDDEETFDPLPAGSELDELFSWISSLPFWEDPSYVPYWWLATTSRKTRSVPILGFDFSDVVCEQIEEDHELALQLQAELEEVVEEVQYEGKGKAPMDPIPLEYQRRYTPAPLDLDRPAIEVGFFNGPPAPPAPPVVVPEPFFPPVSPFKMVEQLLSALPPSPISSVSDEEHYYDGLPPPSLEFPFSPLSPDADFSFNSVAPLNIVKKRTLSPPGSFFIPVGSSDFFVAPPAPAPAPLNVVKKRALSPPGSFFIPVGSSDFSIAPPTPAPAPLNVAKKRALSPPGSFFMPVGSSDFSVAPAPAPAPLNIVKKRTLSPPGSFFIPVGSSNFSVAPAAPVEPVAVTPRRPRPLGVCLDSPSKVPLAAPVEPVVTPRPSVIPRRARPAGLCLDSPSKSAPATPAEPVVTPRPSVSPRRARPAGVCLDSPSKSSATGLSGMFKSVNNVSSPTKLRARSASKPPVSPFLSFLSEDPYKSGRPRSPPLQIIPVNVPPPVAPPPVRKARPQSLYAMSTRASEARRVTPSSSARPARSSVWI